MSSVGSRCASAVAMLIGIHQPRQFVEEVATLEGSYGMAPVQAQPTDPTGKGSQTSRTHPFTSILQGLYRSSWHATCEVIDVPHLQRQLDPMFHYAETL
jgi:hypothetical protein